MYQQMYDFLDCDDVFDPQGAAFYSMFMSSEWPDFVVKNPNASGNPHNTPNVPLSGGSCPKDCINAESFEGSLGGKPFSGGE